MSEKQTNKITIAPGDHMPGVLIPFILEKFFPEFPVDLINLSIPAVLENRNEAVKSFIESFLENGVGVKGSTASESTGGYSVNPVIRSKTGGTNALRGSVTSPTVLISRFFEGGPYSQKNPKIKHDFDTIGFLKAFFSNPVNTMNKIITQEFADLEWSTVTLLTTQSMRLDTIPAMVKSAVEVAKEKNLTIIVGSKHTISYEDRYFKNLVFAEMKKLAVPFVEAKTIKGNNGFCYTHLLSDVLHAKISGFQNVLLLLQNLDGDIAADIYAFASGKFDMFSLVQCANGKFYHEMSLGSDLENFEKLEKGEIIFHNPLLYFYMLSDSFAKANPENEVVLAKCGWVLSTAFAVHREHTNEEGKLVLDTFSFINEVANRLAV